MNTANIWSNKKLNLGDRGKMMWTKAVGVGKKRKGNTEPSLGGRMHTCNWGEGKDWNDAWVPSGKHREIIIRAKT